MATLLEMALEPRSRAEEVPVACENCGQMVRNSVVTGIDLSVWLTDIFSVRYVKPAEHDCREPVV